MPTSVSLGDRSVGEFRGPLLAIALAEAPVVPGVLAELDSLLGGAIARAIDSRDFRAAKDELFYLSGAQSGPRTVALIGMGKVTDRPGSVRRAAALAARQAMKLGVEDMGFHVAELDAREIEAAAAGLTIGSWEYTDLKTPPPEEEKRRPLATASILGAIATGADAALAIGVAIGAGHSLARTLAMMPGNLCTPDFLAKTAAEIATPEPPPEPLKTSVQLTSGDIVSRLETEAAKLAADLAEKASELTGVRTEISRRYGKCQTALDRLAKALVEKRWFTIEASMAVEQSDLDGLGDLLCGHFYEKANYDFAQTRQGLPFAVEMPVERHMEHFGGRSGEKAWLLLIEFSGRFFRAEVGRRRVAALDKEISELARSMAYLWGHTCRARP